jgi:hypothetical protein
MTPFDQVVQYLESSVGGVDIGAHGNFWRGLTKQQFTKYIVSVNVNIPLLKVGDGAGSNLIKALQGDLPFGKNIGVAGAAFNQMPDTTQYPAMPPAQIAFIKNWIDGGCL